MAPVRGDALSGLRGAAILAVLCALPGCVAWPPVCLPPQEPATVAELMFGRNIGDRLGVDARAWDAFFEAEIAPRFPQGSTVSDASGRWRDEARGVVVREPSKVVTLVLRDAQADRLRIDAIVAAYKTRFHQRAVGIILRPACVSF